MKIIKRDGRIVDYDKEKIIIAIGKANNEVSEENKIDKKSILKIISYIEKLNKDRMLVEDIQDIIEQKLMEFKKYNLAKKYIIYRYTRSIIRKANTTDANILSLLKNNDYNEKTFLVANRQRDLMAGEVSRDLAYRLLLPKNVVDKEKENFIKYCDVEYFTEPIIDSSLLNIGDMLNSGTVINDVKIDKPKSFQSACNVLVEIIASSASLQTGKIYIEIDKLYEYYYLTYEKIFKMYKTLLKEYLNDEQIKAITKNQSFIEVKSGIQTLYYQINTITTSNGLVPKVYFIVDTMKITNDEEELICYEFIKQKKDGIKLFDESKAITKYPYLVYSINDNNDKNKPYNYITKEVLSLSRGILVMNKNKYADFVKSLKITNLGSICINLPKIVMTSLNENIDLYEKLDEMLDICFEGFLCKKHNLQGIYAGKSPIHFVYGGLTRFSKEEKIDKILNSKNTKFTLLICGIDSINVILNNDEKTKVLSFIKRKIASWQKNYNINVELSNNCPEEILNKFFNESSEQNKKLNINSYNDTDLEYNSFDNMNCYYILQDENLINEKNVIFYR